ncbi:circadian clock protein KaiC [Zhongshania arctica]|uniref:non-specific serine/threonine protein kinase n=1 Tax=Zhongshania arctica TaxID=3238302 RepID=A0ABV3TU81_9GAMM
MKSTINAPGTGLKKASTGVIGLDEITGGGLPCGRTTLLVGGPGSGKTIFALQFLAHGAKNCDEPGIFVAFEENADRILINADGFGWKLLELRERKLFFIDAQPSPDLIQSGSFDLDGMLAVLEGKISEMGARRIVFDALDVVLALLPDDAARRREVYRLNAWLLQNEMTCIITSKGVGEVTTPEDKQAEQPYGFMQFMADCAIILNHSVMDGVSQRNLRVQKYRGSGFDENEIPFMISNNGLELVVARQLGNGVLEVSKERVSSGVNRLDTMLGGGYYRGATVLITGLPGTAKTTLGGTFVEAACKRGERTLFVSFDADAKEVVRDLSSVGINLSVHLESGCLRMLSARSVTGSAESYLLRIKSLAEDMGARCIVIDPVSTWMKVRNGRSGYSVAARLIDWSKSEGITLLCTSLLDETPHRQDAISSLQISTLADTWIQLNYMVHAGERNRSLAVIKSRGTSHSNQVRELILSNDGVTLADIYTAGGEVLMGTMRWEKESAEVDAAEVDAVATKLKRVRLSAEEAELEVRLKSLQTELLAKQIEKELLQTTTATRERHLTHEDSRLRELRGGDVSPTEVE